MVFPIPMWQKNPYFCGSYLFNGTAATMLLPPGRRADDLGEFEANKGYIESSTLA